MSLKRMAKIRFLDENAEINSVSYAYKILPNLELKEGDYATVQARGNLKVDLTAFNIFKKLDKKRAFLLKQLQKAKEQVNELQILKLLSESNPKLAELFDEYTKVEQELLGIKDDTRN